MGSSERRDNVTVRIYRKGRDAISDIVFTVLLVFVLLGASVRLLNFLNKE